MGCVSSKNFEEDVVKDETEDIRIRLLVVLEEFGPCEVLNLAIEDPQVYQVCIKDDTLRQACITAAVKRYHQEKFDDEDVHNRTVNYVLLLDTFIQVEDTNEGPKIEEVVEEAQCEHLPIVQRRDNNRSDKNGE
ncbi:uncharacterized protein LOC123006657 [Tribolium madens]|uniref:uncharacterized protein LOC123006657 n=1 Tax=Tribolium madens TaxID=41895 RepID=UPI001CF71EAC|nr:uncharacterized protein LOC123006657 [Tribolium madens]